MLTANTYYTIKQSAKRAGVPVNDYRVNTLTLTKKGV